MENASRALLMAASVLVGVLIISVGVALFNSFGGSSKSIITRLEESKIHEFNNNFLKYYGDDVEVTAHDIVSMANVAKQANKKNEVENRNTYSQNSEYIQIRVDSDFNFEKQSEDYYGEFIKNNMLQEDEDGNLTKVKLFECTKIVTNSESGKIIYVQIKSKE